MMALSAIHDIGQLRVPDMLMTNYFFIRNHPYCVLLKQEFKTNNNL